MPNFKTAGVLISFLILLITASCLNQKAELKRTDLIRINQSGYHPNSPKVFLITDIPASSFQIVNLDGETVYSSKFGEAQKWELSGEEIRKGEFTEFTMPGEYYILVDDTLKSFDFEITNNLFENEIKAAVKSYYFQRASMPIQEKYGGIYSRKAGHYDTVCWFDPSTGKILGHDVSSGGWYDAGDYGKYTVNASLSTGQMLSLQEILPNIIPDGLLNIPESGNGTSDLLDELIYELNWLLTMQDDDGGVFHKLTAKQFSDFIMPSDYDMDRFFIGKGTAATLNFAAVMAQAARIYKVDNPTWSENALSAAKKAWNWATKNPDVIFKNPSDIVTGEYGDNEFGDDFFWAATELYITTGNNEYLDYLIKNPQNVIHQITNSWKFFIRNNAFHSILINKDRFPDEFFKQYYNGHLALADSILEIVDNHPYAIGLNHFEWGSNSDILNQAQILCIANYLTNDEKYIEAAVKITDYIFGKNATGYCFLTGYGDKKVMFPHHRQSGADSIVDPVPGFIIGGPNDDRQDIQYVDYTSDKPAKAYIDAEGSYASNEVCLNWNAPAVFVLSYLNNHYRYN